MTHQNEHCIATYISEWDGGVLIETSCNVNLVTGLVVVKVSDEPESELVEVLDREFVQNEAGEQFEVECVSDEITLSDLEGFKASFHLGKTRLQGKLRMRKPAPVLKLNRIVQPGGLTKSLCRTIRAAVKTAEVTLTCDWLVSEGYASNTDHARELIDGAFYH